MPYPEYKSWRTFYLLEPWGWWNDEVNAARLLTMIHNVNAKKPKPLKEFIRDMFALILEHLRPQPDLEDLSPEERKRRIYEAVKKDFGI